MKYLSNYFFILKSKYQKEKNLLKISLNCLNEIKHFSFRNILMIYVLQLKVFTIFTKTSKPYTYSHNLNVRNMLRVVCV